MRFSKPKKAIGLDIGTHSVKAIQMSRSGSGFRVEDVGYALVDRTQLNTNPISAHAAALREALRTMPSANSMLVGALPGQTVVIRYPRLKEVASEALDRAVEAEASRSIPYDLNDVFLDWSLLEDKDAAENEQLKVLLVAAKHEVIDSRVQIADAAEVEYSVLSVDSLALADAAMGCRFLGRDESVALINIGDSSVSIHFMKDGVSNFIRDISWGARELVQAIAKSRRCDIEGAEAVLHNLEAEMAEEEARTEAIPEASVADGSMDTLGSGSSPSMLDPLDEELGTLEEEVAVQSSKPASGNSGPTLLDILEQPISRLVTEIHRSFDYYEHQLYERPVGRIILSGGVAHLPMIRSALMDDLAVEDVVVANPIDGAMAMPRNLRSPEFNDHPAQFMVAMGLAARGAAEL